MNKPPPRLPDQLTVLHRHIKQLTGNDDPTGKLASLVPEIVEHIRGSDKRIADLEQRIMVLSQTSKRR
jgi:hypothetical protein